MRHVPDTRALHGERYAEEFERRNAASGRLERLVPLLGLRPGDTVLDLGCGSGLAMPLVAPRVRRYLGVDFSEPLIAAAKRRSPPANAEFFCDEIPRFCGRLGDPVDVALALDLSEHVPDEPWLSILQAVRGALAPHGRLLLHTPDGSFFVERLKARNLLLRQFPEHVAVRTAAANRSLLQRAGFSRIAVAHLPHYNVLRLLHPLARLPVAGRHLRARLLIDARP